MAKNSTFYYSQCVSIPQVVCYWAGIVDSRLAGGDTGSGLRSLAVILHPTSDDVFQLCRIITFK